MSKVTFKFDVKDIDDEMAVLRVIKSTDLANVVWEFTHNTLINLIKEDASIDDVNQKWIDLLNEHNINIDELIR